jgi:zinc protease
VKKGEHRFVTRAGSVVLVEASHAIPLVDVTAVLRSGSLADPIGKEGLVRIAARMLRMGTRARTAEQTEEALERLGASLVIDVSHGTIRFSASVIARSFPAFMALFGEILSAPALRPADLARVRRESIADLVQQRDNDRWLASRAFRSALFGEHPYARSPLGSAASLKRVAHADVAEFLAHSVTASNLVLGIAGDVDVASLPALLDESLGSLPRTRVAPIPLSPSVRARGRRLVIVDKPGRTQTQMFVGTLGARLRDPDFHTLLVANTAFGGTFSAPLVQEVRARRGYSYSASSRLGADREREAWSVFTHPSTEHVADCLSLELELVDRFVARGPSAAELRFAKSYLVKSHAFDLDTPQKRLDPRVECEVHGLPRSFHERFVDRVGTVELGDARAAVTRRLSSNDLTIALVATAREVERPLRELVDDVRVVPFDRV